MQFYYYYLRNGDHTTKYTWTENYRSQVFLSSLIICYPLIQYLLGDGDTS